MDRLLEQLEEEITTLVDRISHYQPIEECSRSILQLDRDAVAALEELREHYNACRRLEALKVESAQLDNEINETLVGLSECRKLLETKPVHDKAGEPIAADVLLNYATKITRFTKKLPGIEVLPWPTEDQIRKGMLATLAVQRQEEQLEQAQEADELEETKPEQQQHQQPVPKADPEVKNALRPRQSAPKQLINLDLDSDSD
ncbi:Mediator of RNA polymerase II transcription subunit 4 [Wickerhamiella sorbophila]|uniref:Mediator of RNA polymerase II transcription subunit 4 n=1 Tax=Wickerhamiella sorbophila TaxID=45607 RepID=A0A2T0FE12_9ASCO|nr:Mediator of RNA polymerase II transcription subunit 4 [Wickerhamiella sorbophila]PRT53248.1 Mediator of RNA polymerase II transcription subunit 4 [Wickerhamiella sorbophila]